MRARRLCQGTQRGESSADLVQIATAARQRKAHAVTSALFKMFEGALGNVVGRPSLEAIQTSAVHRHACPVTVHLFHDKNEAVRDRKDVIAHLRLNTGSRVRPLSHGILRVAY